MSENFLGAVRRAKPVTSLFVLIAVGCFSPAAVAQESASGPTVMLPTERSVGEQFVIESTQIRERVNGGAVVSSSRQNSVMVATVESIGHDGYVLDLDTQAFDISGESRMPASLTDRLAAIQRELPVKLQMSPEGAVDGLANGPEVFAYADRAMSEVSAHFDSLDMPEEARDLISQIMTQLSDPAYLEQSLLQSPRLYFFMSGAAFEVGATYFLDDAIVFPLFTEPLPSRIFFGIREVDEDERTVTYDWWQEPDQDIFREQLEAMVRRFAEQAGAPPPRPNEINFSSFAYLAEATLIYDLDSGLPLSMRFVKSIDIQDSQQIEVVEAQTRWQ